MKILLLPAYFHPEGVSSPYISRNRNQAFADRGWDMVVYTPTPCRGITDDVKRLYKNKKTEFMFDNHMVVHRFSLLCEAKNPILRALRYFLQNIKQIIRGAFYKDGKSCDVMLVASTPPTQGAMAAIIKKVRKIPLVYNLQDIFPDSLVGTGLAKKDGLLWKIGRILENFTYKNADKIIVISEGFKENLISKGVPESKIEVVYNWIDSDLIHPVPLNENVLFNKFKIEKNKFHVVYAGNLGNAQNIDVILDVAKQIPNEYDIDFLIFGTGGLKDTFVKRTKDEEIKNVHFYPLQPIEMASQVYGLGDVCLVTCKPGIGGAAMPSKTISIMASGKPVIASYDEGELTNILNQYKCGIAVSPGDSQSLASVILKCYEDRDFLKEMGENAISLVNNKFTKESGTKRYVEILENIVSH